jgi:hypothetical protein
MIGMIDLLWKKFCTNQTKKGDSMLSWRDYYIEYELFKFSSWDLEFSESFTSKSWNRRESPNSKELFINFQDCYNLIYTHPMSSGKYRLKVKITSDCDIYHGIGVVNEEFGYGRECMCCRPANSWHLSSSLGLVHPGGIDPLPSVDLEMKYMKGAHFTVTLDCDRETMKIETIIGGQYETWGPIQIVGSKFRFFVSKCNPSDVIYELE